MKRLFDTISSVLGLMVLSPVLLTLIMLIWLQDFHVPLYVAPRVGRGGKVFQMVKLRTMLINADRSGINSTSADDKRITKVGHFIRRFKLDEFLQLWNVLCGQMSLVGQRPQVTTEVALYTAEEYRLLDIKPGITDFSSIVFSDEGDILAGSDNPDLLYTQIIRPWKSRLGLLYIEKQNFLLDLKIILLTITNIISRKHALKGIYKILKSMGSFQKIFTRT